MPRLPPEDGIERHKAYTRLNPSGHKEFVVDDDEETLNELSDDIIDMVESISFGGVLPTGGGAGSPEQPQSDRRHNRLVGSSGDREREAGEDVNNFTSTTRQAADGPELSRAKSKIKTSTVRGIDPRNKYIAGNDGDSRAARSESFTGTGAIAISPGGGYFVNDDDDEDDEDDEDDPEEIQTENNMTRQNDILAENINQLLNEWEPSFKGGEYSPGDYQMPSPTGDGVAERKPKKDKVGAYDTNTSNAGKEWPRKHKDTAAMCDVDEDGVEHKSQGGHESSVGDPKDGHQSELGHNWPDEAKNSGGGVAEPFGGDRWSDGGTLKGGSGQDEMDNNGRPQKMPSSGPITGTSGPQLGQPQEGWNPRDIGTMMEGEFDLQGLFNSYAADHGRTVCLEDFQSLCNAHGCGALLDERSLLQLMESNRQFIFYVGEDANGSYWCPSPIAESRREMLADPPQQIDIQCSECDCDPCECDDDDVMEASPEGWRSAQRNRSEYQVPPARQEGDGSAQRNRAKQGRASLAQPRHLLSQADREKLNNDDEEMSLWASQNISTPRGKWGPDRWEDDEDGSSQVAEGENRRPFGRTISELQVRSAEEESRPYGDSDFGALPGGGIDDYEGPPLDDGDGMPYDDIFNQSQDMDTMGGAGQFGDGCPECGAPDTGEESCSECGTEMGMGSEEAGYGSNDGSRAAGPMGTPEDVDWEDEYYGATYDGPPFGAPPSEYGDQIRRPDAAINGGVRRPSRPGRNNDGGAPGSPFNNRGNGMESRITNSPKIMESLHNFMHSARRILENNQEFNPQHIGEALRYSWSYHARNVNPRTTPTKVRMTLEGLAKRFPAFAVVVESGTDAMGSSDGTAIGTGGVAKNTSHLPTTDTEMNDEGEPLGANQTNNLKGTPEMKGTAKGMDGKGSVPQAVKENVARLSRHVQKAIKEGARSLRGKYNVRFSVIVSEGKNKNRTPFRIRLAEALADAEEILQFHEANDVELEATFSDSRGAVVLKHDVPLLTIKPRGILTTEGAALFRFQRNAENFANELVAEGISCRVVGHNWGSAVRAKASRSIAEGAFRALAKKMRSGSLRRMSQAR